MNSIKEWTNKVLVELMDCNIIQHLNTPNNTSILDGFHKLRMNSIVFLTNEMSNCSQLIENSGQP